MVMCFRVWFKVKTGPGSDEWNHLINRWIETAIENRELQSGGGGLPPERSGGSGEWRCVVEPQPGRDLTEEDRTSVVAWLEGEPSIAEYAVGPLTDCDGDELPSGIPVKRRSSQ